MIYLNTFAAVVTVFYWLCVFMFDEPPPLGLAIVGLLSTAWGLTASIVWVII